MSTLLSDKAYEGKKIALLLEMLAVPLWKMSLPNTYLGSLSNTEIQDKGFLCIPSMHACRTEFFQGAYHER